MDDVENEERELLPEVDVAAGPADDGADDGDGVDDTDGASIATNFGVVADSVKNLILQMNGTDSDSTRPLPAGEVRGPSLSRATHAYVRPAAFDRALDLLTSHPIVYLRGVDGCGRTATAINLLRAFHPGGTIMKMSPRTSWNQLATWSFKKDVGYLIADHSDLGTDASERNHAATTLENLLRDAGPRCRLIVTVPPEGKAPDGIPMVDVAAPPVDAIVDAEARAHGVTIDDATRAALVAAAQDPSPHAVSRLVENAARDPRDVGEFAREAAEQSSAIRHELESASAHRLATMVTLAFFPGTPLPEFDRLSSALSAQLRPPQDPVDSGSGAPLMARSSLRDFPLAAVRNEVIDEFGTTDQVLVPRSDRFADQCLRELSDFGGVAVWDPIARWIDDMIDGTPGDASANTGRRREQIATALGTLARYRPSDVLNRYVYPWLSDSDDVDGRFAIATMVLSALDNPPGSGMQRAVAWCRGADRARATSAALALTGPLGIQYPFEATEALWGFGSRRGCGRMSAELISQLFANTVTAGTDAGAVLRFIRKRGFTAVGGQTGLSARASSLLLRLLRLPGAEGQAMACTQFLAAEPKNVAAFIDAVLPSFNASLTVQRRMIDALLTVLDDAQRYVPEAGLVGAIGTAMETELQRASSTPNSGLTRADIVNLHTEIVERLELGRRWPRLTTSNASTFPIPRASQPSTTRSAS